MILDERTEFMDQVDITAGTGTALVGDVIILTNARDMGNGESLYLMIQVDTQVDSSGDGASVEFVLASDAQEAVATDGTATEHVSTGAVAEADLPAGKRFTYTVPVEGSAYEQYLGILAKTTGEATTAGEVSAFLTLDPAGWQAYPDAL